MADGTHSERPESSGGQGALPSPKRRPRRVWIWTRRLGITVAALVLLLGGLVLLADHQTSKPQFCGSCHIMEPYYESWHADVHGGKLEIACIECHYAPGERATVRAKLRGLSQVASYVSGRYGTSRPRAHVDNLSCMTSKCHGDVRFMDKPISLGTVQFVHAKHLHFDEGKKQAIQRELEELTSSLRQQVGDKRLGELTEVARQAVPANDRLEKMGKQVEDWNVNVDPAQLLKFSQLNHRDVRIAQLADLQCTNCHSYVAPTSSPTKLAGAAPAKTPAHHFTAKTTACFVCHFNNEGFNTGTTNCLMCHALPTKEIMVHKTLTPEESAKLKTPELAKPSIRMDHQGILARKVDCKACHADVDREDSMVTRRDCERCHDRPDYFKEWKEPFSLDLVKQYHAVHVPEQRAKCLDCHTEIHHRLLRGETAAGQPEFLSSAMANCKQCHPNHHADQIKLLMGAGGTGVPKGEPNLMFGSRTNCFGCHIEQATTEHAGVTARGSVSGCIACHGDRHAETFDKWKKGLQVSLMDASEAYDKARKMLETAKDFDPDKRRQAADLLKAAQADLRLVKRGNGIHNLMYSIDLLDSVTQRCQKAMALLTPDKDGKKP
jgi:nitrate/TMAO reductase-like tetraheme cytochrome c subunit